MNISARSKLNYLELVEMLSESNVNKLLPDTKCYNELIISGVIKPYNEGIILIKERGKRNYGY